MALVAFFAARRIVTMSKHWNGSDLPTPKQLTLLIGLLGGNSFGPLKDTIVHRWEARRKLVDPIPLAFISLFLDTFAGALIPIVDTWFGIATTPAVTTQLYNDTSVRHSFGRELSSTQCISGAGDFNGFGGIEWVSCNLNFYSNDPYTIDASLVDTDEATRLQQGISTQNTILNYTTSNSNSGTGQAYYYLAEPGMNALLDFKAKTIVISTQCAPTTQKCLPGQNWPEVIDTGGKRNFTCPPGFKSDFSFNGAVQTPYNISSSSESSDSSPVPLVGIGFSPDSNLTSRVGTCYPNLGQAVSQFVSQEVVPADSPVIGSNWSYQYILPQNPLHLAAWASGFPTFNAVEMENGEYENPLFNDREIYQGWEFAYWVLNCTAIVYDVSYTWSNGSLHTFSATPASADMGGLISAAYSFEFGPANLALSSIANVAGLQNTPTDLANIFAAGWSRAALAKSIGAFAPAQNEIEQVRNSTVAVARVPLIPLYLLLGLKALYVVAVILLAIGALFFHTSSRDRDSYSAAHCERLGCSSFRLPGPGSTERCERNKLPTPSCSKQDYGRSPIRQKRQFRSAWHQSRGDCPGRVCRSGCKRESPGWPSSTC